MKITVISDTHISNLGQELPQQVLNSIANTDMLIHAGDFTTINLLYYLEVLTRVEAVAGNNDNEEIIYHLGKRKIIEVGGYKIGINHGEGTHGDILQRVKGRFADEKVDIVIFGHSHFPYKTVENGILYFNPGSPTYKRRSPMYSYGEITLGKTIKADIIYF